MNVADGTSGFSSSYQETAGELPPGQVLRPLVDVCAYARSGQEAGNGPTMVVVDEEGTQDDPH